MFLLFIYISIKTVLKVVFFKKKLVTAKNIVIAIIRGVLVPKIIFKPTIF